ncbi:MAG: LLM class flavin-dependent oxidoreductase [bacterium]|nr:LLM class flavin-dependent oxidoreductase [bacterium]
MRLGAALPFTDLSGGPLRPDSQISAARTIEQLGYSSIWAFDAVGRGFMMSDPLMALAVAASGTSDVELGTGILQLPIRNVAEVVHRLFSLEVLAPGRVLFGVGPGSTRDDFKVFGGDYGGRFAEFDHQWGELRQFVQQGKADGRDLCAWPQVLGKPALMLAGWRGPWVERAAAEAAGWIASGAHADDDQLAEALTRYRGAGGRRAIVTTIQVGTDVGPTIDRLHRLAAAGFDDAVVYDLDTSVDRLAAVRQGFAS